MITKTAEERKVGTWVIVTAYLLAVVVSNLIVAEWGQKALILTAWIIIPFDFVARDVLHDRWRGSKLWLRIGLLIVAGGIITVLLNLDAARVAMASVATFSVVVVINTLLYQLLGDMPRLHRMVISNAIVSVFDSVMFPLLAFGSVSLILSFSQCVSKALGSAVWAYITVRLKFK